MKTLKEMEDKLAADAVAKEAVRALLALPWQYRPRAFLGIRFNDVFCPACGQGSIEKPNPVCQCENNE